MKLFRFWNVSFFLLICFTGCMRQPPTVEPIRTLAQLNEYRQKGLVPEKIDRIYCSGGTLRLAVYLECADKVVAVDTHEHQERGQSYKKAYLAAHPEFRNKPIGGEKRGRDNPETLLNLPVLPQLIIKSDDSDNGGYDPVELTRRTGIPVLLIPLRSLTVSPEEFGTGIRLMGAALGKSERAEAVLDFFNREMTDIKLRAKKEEISEEAKPLTYVGGVSYNGSHAFNSSEAGYPPFVIAEVNNPVKENDSIIGKRQIMIAKEKILEWNPDILFLDLGTLYLGEASGLTELQTDPAYRSLKAVKEDNVFALLPNNFYFENHDAVLANTWFVAKTIYPEQFTDIDPKKKADEIFTFLVGKPVFEQLNAELNNLALEKLLIITNKEIIRN